MGQTAGSMSQWSLTASTNWCSSREVLARPSSKSMQGTTSKLEATGPAATVTPPPAPSQPPRVEVEPRRPRETQDDDCTAVGGCCRSQSSRYPPAWERFFCNNGTQIQPSIATQAHLFFVFVAAVLAIVLGNYCTDAFKDLSAFDKCQGVEACIKNYIIYRVSFSFFLLFITLTVLTSDFCGCCWEAQVAQMHYGWWYTKVLYTLAVFIATLFIDNGFFEGYLHFCRFCGGFFILMQIVLLIDFAYVWNETWAHDPQGQQASGDDDGLTCWRIGLLASAVVLFGSSFTILGFMYKWFNATDECGFPIAIVTVALVSILLLICFSLTETDPPHNGSLITAAVVTFTITFTTFDALYNHPSTCNSLVNNDDGADSLRTFVGLLLSAFAITRCGYAIITNDVRGGREVDNRPTIDAEGREGAPQGAFETEFIYYHLVLACAMAYMGVLLSDWGAGSSGSTTSMWIKIITSWIMIVLYLWSVAAPSLGPVLCPCRDWSQPETGGTSNV